ncbi:hypothetical protein Acr_16g0001550 [Actinidia rufa]|uniref:Retrovirus-related Pol polyprotein from transposon TNT 1-94-like beta-barrel domain-containing protein n=1 Tax=Actinidia rufa TaxID=165716 RepID=A0A7J0FXW0_9ERIC|nr:hypothetical protein Acr_16g0001550 [Actinidia rufa]
MAVDESDILLAALADGKLDWVLDLGNAYHLYRDREVFSTYAACEGRVWMANNMATRVVGKGSVRFRMADGRSVTLTEFIRETRRCYREGRLECYTDWRGVSRQGELLSDMGPVPSKISPNPYPQPLPHPVSPSPPLRSPSFSSFYSKPPKNFENKHRVPSAVESSLHPPSTEREMVGEGGGTVAAKTLRNVY